MVAIYCRVSTVRQESGSSLKDQEELGIEYAQKNGVDYEVYKEAAGGESIERRDAWKQLEDDIKNGNEIKTVWVKDNTRFSRDKADSMSMWKMMHLNNVNLYMDDQKKFLKYDDDTDSIIFSVQSATSESERRRIKRRVRPAIKKKIEAGERAWARVYGYRRFPHPTVPGKSIWKIHPEMAKTVKYAFQLFVNEGLSLKKLTFRLNEEGHKPYTYYFPFKRRNGEGLIKQDKLAYSKIGRILRQWEYIGKTKVREKDEDGKVISEKIIDSKVYPKIVDEEIFYKAQRILPKLKENSFVARYSNHLCSNVIKCKECGATYMFHQVKRSKGLPGYLYYYSHNDYRKCSQIPKCLQLKVIDRIFNYLYFDAMFDFEMTNKMFEEEQKKHDKEKSRINRAIEVVEKKISEAKVRKERLLDALENETVDMNDIKERLDTIKEEISQQQQSKNNLQIEIEKKEERTRMILAEFSADNATEFLKQPTVGRQRTLLKRIIDSAVVDGFQINVKLITGKQYRFDYKKLRDAEVKLVETKKDLTEIGDEAFKLLAAEKLIDRAIEENDFEILEKGMKQIAGKRKVSDEKN